MEKKELRPVCSLGMFDFFKGITILSILFAHTRELFPAAISANKAFFLYMNCGLNAFYVAAGFGFRKRSTAKCLSQIRKNYLIPYLYALVLTPLLLFVMHMVYFHYFPAALKEGLSSLSGFLLGQYPTANYFGWTVYSCGPMWFVVALAIAWFIFNFLLNHVEEKKLPWVVGAIALLSYFSDQFFDHYEIPLPFSITRALFAVLGLYLGYWAKKTHFFEKKPSSAMWCIFAAALVISFVKYDEPQGFSGQSYPLGIFSLAALYILGMAMLYLMTHINRRYNFVVNAFEKIGHNTIDILVLHTIEYYGMLWYHLAERFTNRPALGTAVVFALRCLFITAGLLLISLYKRVGGLKGIRDALCRKTQKA